MLKKLLGLSDEKLNYYLARIKEIGQLGKEASIIEVDKFLWEILEAEKLPFDDSEAEDEDSQLDLAKEEIDNFVEDVTDLKRDVKRGSQVDGWVVDDLKDTKVALGQDWSEDVKREFAEKLNEALTYSEIVLNDARELRSAQELEMERQRHLENVASASKRTIYNFSSVQAVISQADLAAEFFEEKDLFSDDLKKKIRAAKEREQLGFEHERNLMTLKH